MNRFSVLALLIAASVGLSYAFASAAPSAPDARAKSACGCQTCKCPDCNGEFCTCDDCKYDGCACLKADDKTPADATLAAATVGSCCSVAAKPSAKTGCGCEVCKCPDCNGEFCTCETCECVGCGCAK